MTQESAQLFNCFRCCRRGGAADLDDLDNTVMMDESQLLDNSVVLEQLEETAGPVKKRVVPNSNQDKWLFYLLQNLNKANDLPWVTELLERIELNQYEFNAGKFRGAVFQMNYIAKENLKRRITRSASSIRQEKSML